MPVVERTLQQLRHELSRGFQDLIATNGSLADPTVTTIFDRSLVQQHQDVIRGGNLYLYTGGGSSEPERPIYAFTPYSPASPSLYGRVDVLQGFAAAPSTNTGWEIHKLFKVSEYNDAIFRAMRKHGLRMLTAKEDYSIISRAALRNGTFHLWPNGTSSAPGGWSLTGSGASVARSTNSYQGLYSASLTNGAGNMARLEQDITQLELYAGQTVSFRVKVYTTTASRVRLNVSDGVSTFSSSYHNGASDNERDSFLEINDVELSNALTELSVRLTIETGGAITAIWQKVYDNMGLDVHEYDIPNSEATRFARLQHVYTEGSQDGVFDVLLPKRWWSINKESSPRRLVLDKGVLPNAGKVLKLVGQGFAVEPSTETTTIPVDNEMVLEQAGVFLINSLPNVGELSSQARGLSMKYQQWLTNLRQYEDRSPQFSPNSVEVETP